MVQIELNDIDIGESSGHIYCKDTDGYTYRFSTDYEKAKLISLLLHGVYVPSNSVYELFLKFLGSMGHRVHSVAILDGYKNKAVINITDGSTIKPLPIAIDDAFIISLLSNTPIFLRREACFLDAEELENYVWYRFLKELDLC